ncbi:hypothetical protein [Porphyrobacter sp. AAP60]|uniref:hypothetical protein n=1 Tax=Porphyrobacter sp. AAP60 TaxID=1523423 RepID=UPI0012E19A52|nr:hypothetical protein [Porphyrobacter sp. AAP60]
MATRQPDIPAPSLRKGLTPIAARLTVQARARSDSLQKGFGKIGTFDPGFDYAPAILNELLVRLK